MLWATTAVVSVAVAVAVATPLKLYCVYNRLYYYNDINSRNKPSFCGRRTRLRRGHVFLVFVHTQIRPVLQLQSPTRNRAQCLENRNNRNRIMLIKGQQSLYNNNNKNSNNSNNDNNGSTAVPPITSLTLRQQTSLGQQLVCTSRQPKGTFQRRRFSRHRVS